MTPEEANKLATVAEMMNEWTKEESEILYRLVQSLKDDCRELDLRVYHAEGEMQQMEALVDRLQQENRRLQDSNQHLRNANALLHNRTIMQRNQIYVLESRVLDMSDSSETESEDMLL